MKEKCKEERKTWFTTLDKSRVLFFNGHGVSLDYSRLLLEKNVMPYIHAQSNMIYKEFYFIYFNKK